MSVFWSVDSDFVKLFFEVDDSLISKDEEGAIKKQDIDSLYAPMSLEANDYPKT